MAANNNLGKLLLDQLGVDTYPRLNPDNSVIGVTALRIAPNNGNRASLNIINLSANTVFVNLTPQVSSSNGIGLDANGGAVSLNWEYDLALVSNEWWAVAEGANSSILVIEVLLK